MNLKQILLFSLIFLSINSFAQNINFHQSNGMTRFQDYSEMDSINFSEDEKFVSFFSGDVVASYPLTMIDSLTFNMPIATAEQFPSATEFKDEILNDFDHLIPFNGEDTEEIYSQEK